MHWLALIGLMALACLCHRVAIVHACALIAALVILALATTGALRSGRLVIGAAVVFDYIVFAIVSKNVSWQDIARLNGGNFLPGAVSLALQPGLPWAIKLEFALCLVALTVAIAIRRPGIRLLVPVALLMTAFIPAFGQEPFSFGERLGLFFPYFCTVFICSSVREDGTAALRTPDYALIALAVAVNAFRIDYSYPLSLNPPYEQYAKLTDELGEYDIPMLILHRGMHFYYKYTSGRDAFSYEPEKHWDGKRVWRLVHGVSPEEAFAYLPTECSWGEAAERLREPQYLLVRENCYAQMRAAIRQDMNPELYDLLWSNTMNPSRPRPDFLYKKHTDDPEEAFPALPPQATNGS